MNKPVEKLLAREVDVIQLKLTEYAKKLRYEDQPADKSEEHTSELQSH
mgnify:CR=1 FL=1